jgi:hypothetical protein
MTNSLSHLSLGQLKQALQLKEKLASLESELSAILGGDTSLPETPAASSDPAPAPRRRGRPPGIRALSTPAPLASTARVGSRRISPAARARIIAGAKARWARFHAAKAAAALPAKKTRSTVAVKRGKMSREERGRLGALARWAKIRKNKG